MESTLYIEALLNEDEELEEEFKDEELEEEFEDDDEEELDGDDDGSGINYRGL